MCIRDSRSEPALDPRKQKGKGYEPEVYVATFLFGFCTGGTNMADFERLNKEEGLKGFLGIKSFPDQTTLGEWLRNIGQKLRASSSAIWDLNFSEMKGSCSGRLREWILPIRRRSLCEQLPGKLSCGLVCYFCFELFL